MKFTAELLRLFFVVAGEKRVQVLAFDLRLEADHRRISRPLVFKHSGAQMPVLVSCAMQALSRNAYPDDMHVAMYSFCEWKRNSIVRTINVALSPLSTSTGN